MCDDIEVVLCWGTGTSGQLGSSSSTLPAGFTTGYEFMDMFRDYPMTTSYYNAPEGTSPLAPIRACTARIPGWLSPVRSPNGAVPAPAVSFDWSVSRVCHDKANFGRFSSTSLSSNRQQCNNYGSWASTSYTYSPSTENIGWWFGGDGSTHADTMYVDDIVVTDASGTIVYEQDFEVISGSS